MTSSACQRSVGVVRSEEHTSELQSHSDLVCRLLLEKKESGTKTIAMLKGSVDGVITADRMSRIRMAYLRKERILSALATPSLARMNITTGSWNARPNPNISVRKKVMTEPPSGLHSKRSLMKPERNVSARGAAKKKAYATPSRNNRTTNGIER